jgi:hypothetical protein
MPESSWVGLVAVLGAPALAAAVTAAAFVAQSPCKTPQPATQQTNHHREFVHAAVHNDIAALSIALSHRCVEIDQPPKRNLTSDNDGQDDDDDDADSTATQNASNDVVGTLALILAAQQGHDQVVEMLLHSGVSPHPLDLMCDLDSIDDHSLDDYAADIFTWSPLVAAARSGQSHVVRVLLEWGADANCARSTIAMADISNDGTTALMYAAVIGSMKCVSVLLEFGADASARNVQGSAAWEFAENSGFGGLAGLLMHEAAAAEAERHAHRDASAVKAVHTRAKIERNIRHQHEEAQADRQRQAEEALKRFGAAFRRSATGQLEALSVSICVSVC